MVVGTLWGRCRCCNLLPPWCWLHHARPAPGLVNAVCGRDVPCPALYIRTAPPLPARPPPACIIISPSSLR